MTDRIKPGDRKIKWLKLITKILANFQLIGYSGMRFKI